MVHRLFLYVIQILKQAVTTNKQENSSKLLALCKIHGVQTEILKLYKRCKDYISDGLRWLMPNSCWTESVGIRTSKLQNYIEHSDKCSIQLFQCRQFAVALKKKESQAIQQVTCLRMVAKNAQLLLSWKVLTR